MVTHDQEDDILRRLDGLLYPCFSENPPEQYARWLYVDGRRGDYTVATQDAQTSKLALIKRLKSEWRSERLRLPATWMSQNPTVKPFNDSTLSYGISIMTAPIRSILEPLAAPALAERCMDGTSTNPDFCLQRYRTLPHFSSDVNVFREIETAYKIEDELMAPCEATVAPLMSYPGGEHLARYVISGMFSGIPGCWLSPQTKYRLPASFKAPEQERRALEFSVLAYPQSSASVQNRVRDAALEITLTHPAVFLGMKGAQDWNWASAGEQSLANIDDIVRDLAAHAQPNLNILHATWRIHHQYSSQCPPLPDYAIIFGVIYDAKHLHIVAHFLSDNLDYVSILVDTFDFPSMVDEDNVDFAAWSENRTRMVVALLTVQKHVHRLASPWDDVHFPQDIVQLSSELDDHIMGPTYMVRTSPSVYSQTSNDSKWYLYCAQEDEDDEEDDECDEGEGDDKGEVNGEVGDDGDEEASNGLEAVSVEYALEKHIQKWINSVRVEELENVPEPESYLDLQLQETVQVHAASGNDTITRWKIITKFQATRRGGPAPQARVHEISRAISGRHQSINIPQQWFFSEFDKNVSWDEIRTLRHAFEMYLKGVFNLVLFFKLVKCSGSSRLIATPCIYPELDESIEMDVTPRALRLLLTHLSHISYERNVLDIMLETLSGFFEMPGCQVSHTFTPHPGSPSVLPSAIRSRMVIRGVPDSNSPTLLVALPWDARPLDEGQRVLTSYFKWTLELLTKLQCQISRSEPLEIPIWCILYGMVYTARGVRVCAHYPQWDGNESRWQFVSEDATHRMHEEAFFLPRSGYVIRLAGTLLALRRHAWEVKVNLEAWLEQCGQDVLLER